MKGSNREKKTSEKPTEKDIGIVGTSSIKPQPKEESKEKSSDRPGNTTRSNVHDAMNGDQVSKNHKKLRKNLRRS